MLRKATVVLDAQLEALEPRTHTYSGVSQGLCRSADVYLYGRCPKVRDVPRYSHCRFHEHFLVLDCTLQTRWCECRRGSEQTSRNKRRMSAIPRLRAKQTCRDSLFSLNSKSGPTVSMLKYGVQKSSFLAFRVPNYNVSVLLAAWCQTMYINTIVT